MAQGVAEPPWPEAEKARLRELCADPELSILQIAVLMKRSKNSVMGMRARMGLTGSRPSPIKPKAEGHVELTPAQRERREAGFKDALPAGHPIAVAVLAEAGIRFARGTWPHG